MAEESRNIALLDVWHVGTPWRHPAVESDNLYPGLVVHDGRVTGSITVGKSRLPLWAFITWAVGNWDEIESGYAPTENYGFTEKDLSSFLYNLMELRGEFGRLLLVLADAERCEHNTSDKAWWQTKRHRKRVADQMRRCLAVLDGAAK